MGADAAWALVAAWAVALLTLLPPGLLEAGACRVFAHAGLRAAAGFLGGIALLDAGLIVTMLGTGWIGKGHEPSPALGVTAGAAVCILAIRRLGHAHRSDRRVSAPGGIPVLVGMRAAIESPGWWNWWLLVGSVAMAAGSATPLAVGSGLMTGVLSWALLVLLTIRAGGRFIARIGERRWELATAWLLLLGGVLLAARSLL